MNVVYMYEKWGRVRGRGALLGVVSGGISTGNVGAPTEVAFRVAVCSKIKDLFKRWIASSERKTLLFSLSHRWHFGREGTFLLVLFGHNHYEFGNTVIWNAKYLCTCDLYCTCSVVKLNCRVWLPLTYLYPTPPWSPLQFKVFAQSWVFSWVQFEQIWVFFQSNPVQILKIS